MGHKEIIEKLSALLPDIQRTHDPDGVMLKFAKEHNFAPAQLEKLAQVYNIAKTITFMDKSAARDGEFTLVDTEKLLEQYQAHRPKTAGTSDWDNWFDKAAGAEVITEERFPDVYAQGTPELDASIKAAADLEQLHREAQSAMDDESSRVVELSYLSQIQDDLKEEARGYFDKIAEAIQLGNADLATLEADARDTYGDTVVPVLANLTNYLGQLGVKSASLQNYRQRLGRDRTGLLGTIKQAHDALDLLSASVKYAAEVAADEAKRTSGKSRPRLDAIKPKDSKSTDSPSVAKQVTAVGENLLSRLSGKSLAADAGDIAAPLQGAEKALAAIRPGKDRHAKQVEEAGADADHQIVLQRLLLTDPIIGEHDPHKVVELANSIRSAHPDGGRDINFMRFALREALQYDGVPLHTYKDMIGMHKDKSQAHESDRKRDAEVFTRS